MAEAPAYEIGFRSVESEHPETELPMEGTLPDWLDGCLYRNGPGLFETASGPVEHWFDGLALLRRFRLDGSADTIHYTDRFLRSEAYRRAQAGEGGAAQFGTSGGSGLFGRLRSTLIPETTDNATVNVVPVGDRLIAVTETPEMVEVEPETLETRGAFAYDDDIPGQWQSAHPVRDPTSGATLNLLIDFGRTSSYEVVVRPEGATSRRHLASLPVDEPAYTHSFAVTDRYVVLTEPPFQVDPLDLLLPWRGGEAFVDAFQWRPERGTRFRLLDRQTGEVRGDYRGPAMFVFHHVNAFERDDRVLIDLVGFPDDRAVDGLYLDELRGGTVPPRGTLWRVELPLEGSAPRRRSVAEGVSLPRTNERYLTRNHRFTWAQGRGPDVGFADRVVKLDPEAGIAASWKQPGCFCGEPVVVPHPAGETPDAGALLVVILDPDLEECRVTVLDAASLEEHATAPLPDIVPFDFHGQFLPATGEKAFPSR